MSRRRTACAAALLALGAGSTGVQAQEFSRFLPCTGSFVADGQTREANADFALRSNSRTALIQNSNVLPVGETLHYLPTPANYSMTYLLRPRGTQVIAVPGWFTNTILILYPNLKRLNQIRLSINRQTGQLQGKMLNQEDEQLASFSMQCQSQSEEQTGAPKF